MPNFNDKLQGLLGGGNASFDLGVGLLGAAGPSLQPHSIGQDLASATQFASSRQRAAIENDLLRQRVSQGQQRQQAIEALPGLLGNPNVSQKELLGGLLSASPDSVASAAASSLLTPTRPTSLQTNVNAFGFDQTPEGLVAFRQADAAGRGNANLDVPVPLNQLPLLRGPNGESAPPGITFRQVQENGFTAASAAQQARTQKFEGADQIWSQLNDVALGDNGLFKGLESGFVNRARAGVQFGVNLLTQEDPRVQQYNDLREGTLSPLIRAMGESGALNEGDVRRAGALVPTLFGIGGLPDTEEVARDKMLALKAFIDYGLRNANDPNFSGSAEPLDLEAALAATGDDTLGQRVIEMLEQGAASAAGAASAVTDFARATTSQISDFTNDQLSRIDTEQIVDWSNTKRSALEDRLMDAYNSAEPEVRAFAEQRLEELGSAISAGQSRWQDFSVEQIGQMTMEEARQVRDADYLKWSREQKTAFVAWLEARDL